MLFNSTAFLIFAPIVLAGHALLNGRGLRIWLLVASYVFYGWAVPWYCVLLFLTSVVDYHVGLAIGRTEDPRRRKLLLTLGIAVALTLLGTFKYADFFARNFNDVMAVLGIAMRMPRVALPLPVGISFYTFQSMSYTLDVYRRQMKPADNFLTFALYVAFFPQLMAGPIERARVLLPQVAHKPSRDTEDVLAGTSRILWGLLKKLAFADWLALYVGSVYTQPGSASGLELLIATYAFAFQIYLDFSAYSDIAIGLARFMGIRLMENFRWPYHAPNMPEFWRRWHISLTTWLRDYLYYSLGGSRRGTYRTVLNLVIVMFLAGLWHGAHWTFVLWGLWIGLWFALFEAWRRVRPPRGEPSRVGYLAGVFVTFHALLVSWVLFRASSLTAALTIYERIAGFAGGFVPRVTTLGQSIIALGLVTMVVLAHVLRAGRVVQWVRRPVACGLLWAALVAIIAVCHAPVVSRFIYFEF